MTKKEQKSIGKYDIIKTLGKGGMGIVYLCKDPELNRQVAVKILHKTKSKNSPREIRFLREAYTTAQLQHPGIPPVYTIDKLDNDKYYYVMKPIEGKSLREIMDSLRDEPDKFAEKHDILSLVEILRDVCQTIHYAHIKGYIHRDLKPSNIFVGNYGEVYVIDWGLTKAIKDINTFIKMPDSVNKLISVKSLTAEDTVSTDSIKGEENNETVTLASDTDSSNTLTLSGDVVGTIAYMPPEQAEGDISELSKQSDIYAIGVILYEMLTLELPISGMPFSDIVNSKRDANFERPEVKSPYRNIPPELSVIAMQALSPNPDDRFKTAHDLNRALEQWIEGKPRYRQVSKGPNEDAEYQVYPSRSAKLWHFEKDTVNTLKKDPKKESTVMFKREFHGDIKLAMDVIAYPKEIDSNEISEIGILINASEPDKKQGVIDSYSIHLGASSNTRAYLAKNDAEVASNEYVSLVPRQRYKLTIESTAREVRVFLDRQIILFFRDNAHLTGAKAGFIHKGEGINYSQIRTMVRGLPLITDTIDIPEALMNEKCYEAAMKKFMTIASSHSNRFAGAWARYRAGMAAYYISNKKIDAYRIWRNLKKTPFPAFEDMGKAVIELERNNDKTAARLFREIVEKQSGYFYLDPIADIVFGQAQKYLRSPLKSKKDWECIDRWTRLALILGKKIENKKAMTPSIMWRWLFIALSDYPENLKSCVLFLRKNFGKGQGAFAEALTCIEPLLNILKRSIRVSEQGFMIDKLMRLILSYDDHLGNLETLARFYLQSGNEDVAEKISLYICNICTKNKYDLPPMPIVYISIIAWLKKDWHMAERYFKLMIKHSMEWAQSDGKLLLGLEMYRKGKADKANAVWSEVKEDPVAISFNRHMVAKGMLEELPFDPVAAQIPNRSDHRLLYALFIGFKNYIDWIQTGEEEYKTIAVDLFLKAKSLLRPSYDIYSTAESFIKIPLQNMDSFDEEKWQTKSVKLTKAEISWLERLTKAAEKDEFNLTRRTTTNSGKKGSR
ncbi:MAG: protein kinase domain-containing protein [Planctomycetota bacterium]|jgi:serine/threonine protein kinase